MNQNNHPTCPSCGNTVYDGKLFTFKNHEGTWHAKCYEQAFKEGKTVKKKHETCNRCNKPIEHDNDSFQYENPRTKKSSYLHGACLITQMDRDHGFDRTEPYGNATNKRKY